MKTPDYYEILGVPQDATQEQIKRRYRDLARRYHPDISRSADAAETFKRINEANQVLSDPQKRAAYDTERAFTQSRQRPSPSPPPPPPSPSRPATASSGASGAGARPASSGGQTFGGAQRSARGAGSGGTNRAHAPGGSVDTLIAQAQAAFRSMNYREAERLCRQVNRRRPHPVAMEMLGDIHRMRGHLDEAIAMYSYALQLDPRNSALHEKFDRLVGARTGPTMAGNAARNARARGASSVSLSPRLRMAVTGVGIALILFLALLVMTNSETAAKELLPLHWNGMTLFALGISGFMGGLLMSLNGFLHSAREELSLRAAGRARRFTLSLGTALVFFSLVWFYASLSLYLLIGYLQETTSRSVLRAFGASFCLIALFMLARPDSAVNLLLFGGNIIFAAYVMGWMLGDTFQR
jgi:curved DNA-binding protein CbpA